MGFSRSLAMFVMMMMMVAVGKDVGRRSSLELLDIVGADAVVMGHPLSL